MRLRVAPRFVQLAAFLPTSLALPLADEHASVSGSLIDVSSLTLGTTVSPDTCAVKLRETGQAPVLPVGFRSGAWLG